jgi:cell division protein FtsL
MLVGIVAMQVELLKLNADTGRSIELIGSLQARNDVLRAQVASASDPNRIERLAGRMGMTMPSPESITFVKAGSASVRRALARIRVPNLAAFEAALRASNVATALPTTSPSGAGHGASKTSTASGGQTSATTPTTSTAATTPTTNTTATTPNTGTSTTAVTASSTGATTSPPSAPAATVP